MNRRVLGSEVPATLAVSFVFLILLTLVLGYYFLSLYNVQGERLEKEAEAASEQAVIYIFGFPKNITSGSIYNETKLVIHNTGIDIRIDRILAIGKSGEIVADVRVPGQKGLATAQWQMYKPSELGLPERMDNFGNFKNEVSRLVLKSLRGRTHGSIWGVPPFLEMLLESTITRTIITNRTYIYATTTQHITYLTVTFEVPKMGYSVTGEFAVINRGISVKNNEDWPNYAAYDYHVCCADRMKFEEWARGPALKTFTFYVVSTKYGNQSINPFIFPGIAYALADENIMLGVRRSFRVDWYAERPRDDCSRSCPNGYPGCYCYKVVTEGYTIYTLAFFELYDMDTGELYGRISFNASGGLGISWFQIMRNTKVRAVYNYSSYTIRSWFVDPPPPTPHRCQQIIDEVNSGVRDSADPEACRCYIALGLPRPPECTPTQVCLYVNIDPCCVGGETHECLSSWSVANGIDCKYSPVGTSVNLTAVATVSFTVAPGWRYDNDGLVHASPGVKCRDGVGETGGRVTCQVTATAPYEGSVRYIVIFRKVS